MLTDMSQFDSPSRHEPEVDQAVFEQALSLGSVEFRLRLAQQLTEDFARLRDELGGWSLERRRAAAHELKGLAATIGAERLAGMALVHEVALDSGALHEARLHLGALNARIDAVMTLLASEPDRSAVA